MRHHVLITLATALTLAGCHNAATNAAGNAADSTASAAGNGMDAMGSAASNGMSAMGDSASNGMSAMGNGVANIGNTSGVNKAEDATAAAVGAMGANAPRTAEGFVKNAALSDMYEIEASKLAEAHAKSPEIKKFAREMIADHTKTTAKLKPAAKAAGITPPTELDNRRQGLINNLKTAGADFDKTYATQQAASHQEALDLMQNYAKNGENAQLKAVAAEAEPIVAHHLEMAKALAGK